MAQSGKLYTLQLTAEELMALSASSLLGIAVARGRQLVNWHVQWAGVAQTSETVLTELAEKMVDSVSEALSNYQE